MSSLSSAADTFAEARADLFDNQAKAYKVSSVESRYTKETGLLPIPVMGPAGTPPSVVRVHAGYGIRETEFAAAKDGSPPVFPAPADTQSGDILLNAEIAFPAPTPGGRAMNGLRFGVSGKYTFLQPGTGRGTEDTFPIDAHPFITAVDGLGQLEPTNQYVDQDSEGFYNFGEYDLRYLCTYRMLG